MSKKLFKTEKPFYVYHYSTNGFFEDIRPLALQKNAILPDFSKDYIWHISWFGASIKAGLPMLS